MKLIPRLLVLLTLFPCIVFAQANFKPGYILKNSGDTVKGYINYREWSNSPKSIEFKALPGDAKATVYQPVQLQAFGITGMDKYITYKGPVTMDDNVFPGLPPVLDTTTRVDTLFLQVLYQGQPLSLFSQRDEHKTRFFIQENNKQLVELKYHQYYSEAQQVTSISPYTRLLTRLSAKYNPTQTSIYSSIQRSKFSGNDLLTITKLINNDTVKTVNAGTSGTRFFAGVALYRTTTKFSGDNPFTSSPSSSYVPRINAGFDYFPNKYTQRFILRMELGLSAISPSFTRSGYSVVYKYRFKQYTISLTPQAIYNVYSKDDFKAYLGAGVILNNSINTKQSRKTEILETVLTTTTSDNYELKNFWMGYQLQAGVIVNRKINVYALYAPALTSYTDYMYFDIKNTSYGLGINYLFGK